MGEKMHLTVIGLGKMGLSLAQQLLDQGKSISGFDINQTIAQSIQDERFTFLNELNDLKKIEESKIVLLLLPAGDITHQTIEKLSDILSSQDVIIDFSNSYFKNSIQEYHFLASQGIVYHDCGLSGGVSGARNGSCMMLGGAEYAEAAILALLSDLCVPGGFDAYVGVGSGHYLKMVHNGIEYGMMQAIAEGLALLDGQERFDYDLEKVTANWSSGSIIESALLNHITDELRLDNTLSQFSDKVSASGEAKWMVKEALDEEVPVPVTALALMKRNASLASQPFSNKVISAMRYHFGGHREF